MVENSGEEQTQSLDEEFEPEAHSESTEDEPSQKSSPEYRMETEDESDESSNFKSR